MGEYTPTFKFYKPDPTEFIDPETQLNRNWDIADTIVKRALEYEYTTQQNPVTTDTLSRSRFYKTYSNAVVAWLRSSGGYFYQGTTAFVSTWVSGKTWLASGWNDHDDFPLFVRIVRTNAGGPAEVEWYGCISMGEAKIPANTNYTVIPSGGIPAGYRPSVTKHFEVSAGNTTTQYSFARLIIGSDGRVEIIRYGTDPITGSGENRIEFTGIKYDPAVGA